MRAPLHRDVRATPAVRAEVARSGELARALPNRFGITEQTVYKWKKREVFTDRSHMAHRVQTTLAQEVGVVELRRTLLAENREILRPDVSRSGLDSVFEVTLTLNAPIAEDLGGFREKSHQRRP